MENDFGDFFLDGDGLENDVQLSIVDNAKKQVLEALEKITHESLTDLKVNDRSSVSAKIELISSYTSLLIRLDGIDEANTPINEQQEIIEEVLKQTTEITLSNMDEVLKSVIDEDDDNVNGSSTGSFDGDDGNSGLDF